MRKFLQFTQFITDTYKKSSNTGFKAPPVKMIRWNQDEAELFQDRNAVENSKKPRHQGNELVALNTFSTETNFYHIVHYDDTKSCPQKSYHMQILQNTIYKRWYCPYQDEIKQRIHLSKNWQRKMSYRQCLFGPLTEFLKGDDDNVRFESVVVLKETRSRLPKTASEMFVKQNFSMAK